VWRVNHSLRGVAPAPDVLHCARPVRERDTCLGTGVIDCVLRGEYQVLMWRTTALLALFLALGMTISCSGEKETEGGGPAAVLENISYGAGIFNLENGAEGSWRWIGKQGTVKLRNSKTGMRLKIAGSAPIDLIGEPSQVTITFNGEQLEQVTLTKENKFFDKEFEIPASRQTNGGSSELTIISSKSFIPKQVYENSSDDRILSFSLTKLEWEPKP